MMNNRSKSEGIFMLYASFEFYLVDVPYNFWWIDTRASRYMSKFEGIYVTNLLQGFERRRKPSQRLTQSFEIESEKNLNR